jgi:hypothetical protein
VRFRTDGLIVGPLVGCIRFPKNCFVFVEDRIVGDMARLVPDDATECRRDGGEYRNPFNTLNVTPMPPIPVQPKVRSWGEADINLETKPAGSVENDRCCRKSR